MRQATPIDEGALYKRPRTAVPLADYPVVDMEEVFVANEDWTEPADLLLAHPRNPVMLKGIVNHDGCDYELTFPVMTGFSVESGDEGLQGNCKLFALGNCCWYRLCSPALNFEKQLMLMQLESRIYWILQDKRGDWMNLVDQRMQKLHPNLDEARHPRKYTECLKQVVSELESTDTAEYEDYWRRVDYYVNAKPTIEASSSVIGLNLATRFVSYILHHMLVDKELNWQSSQVFKQLGLRDLDARNTQYTRHDVEIPVRNPRRAKLPEERKVKQEPSEEHVAAVTTLARPASADLESTVITASRKRKREASESESEGEEVKITRIDKSRGFNDFQSRYSVKVKKLYPTMKPRRLTRMLARLWKNGGCAGIEMLTDENPVFSVPETWRNIRTERSRDYPSSYKAPFDLVFKGSRQTILLKEVLQGMLYDEVILDLNLHDLRFVLIRDCGITEEQFPDIVVRNVVEILQLLSELDRRQPELRPRISSTESVNEHNLWRAMTIYDQFYKIYRISVKAANLLKCLVWDAEDIFYQVQCNNGDWSLRVIPELTANSDHDTGEPTQLATPVSSSHGSMIHVQQSDTPRASKGQSVLRPFKEAKSSGAHCDLSDSTGSSPIRSTFAAKSAIDLDHDTVSLSATTMHSEEHQRVLTYGDGPRNTIEDIPHPAPRWTRPSPIQLVSLLSTKGNNANIWRCQFEHCTYFKDDCMDDTAQEDIYLHCDKHADELYDRVVLLDELERKGNPTRHIIDKLAREAERWKQIMNRDALVFAQARA